MWNKAYLAWYYWSQVASYYKKLQNLVSYCKHKPCIQENHGNCMCAYNLSYASLANPYVTMLFITWVQDNKTHLRKYFTIDEPDIDTVNIGIYWYVRSIHVHCSCGARQSNKVYINAILLLYGIFFLVTIVTWCSFYWFSVCKPHPPLYLCFC